MLPLEALLGGFPISPFGVGPGRHLLEDVVIEVEGKEVERCRVVVRKVAG